MKSILPYYRHLKATKWPFIGGVLAGLIYALASGAGLPVMLKYVIPVIFDQTGDFTNPFSRWLAENLAGFSRERVVLVACLAIPFVFLVRAVAGYANSYLIQLTGLRVLEGIRVDLFAKLQQLPIAFFRKNRSGDLLARVMNDTEVLRQVLANASSDLIKQPATLVFAIGYLVFSALQNKGTFVALISMASVPICVFIIRAAGKNLARRARTLQEKSGDLSATLTETLQSAFEIRAYNLQERQTVAFAMRIREILRLAMKVVKYRQAVSPSIEFVAATGFAVALYVGVDSGMSLEDFLGLGAALYMSYDPIKKIGNIHTLLKQGEAATERLDFIFKEPITVAEPASPRPIGAAPSTEISFDQVSFAYGDEAVLRNIDLRFPVGQVVALVGPSGAGKSTFVSLLPRFYDPQEGAVRLDGVDLRELSTHDLRSRIAVVPQMPALFSGSIADNIRIGKLDASDDEVKASARRAFAHDFIAALPAGYETVVGERGDTLSGGQRQRIAIARAFLRDAAILILDEATSALDGESEAQIQQALVELVKGRTTFIIAHRFSTITIAERVLVFRDGEIIADGSHAELRASEPLYQAMLRGFGEDAGNLM